MTRWRPPRGLLRILLLAAAAAATPRPVGAQQALVLSGGSARGLAHVGVLQEMEALGYDPDIVVGTSMGAVVGALYAAGYTPDEIRERILAIDWGEMFDPAATVLGPESVLRLPQATFTLAFSDRRVSRGLFGDWRINRALVRLLFGANARAAGDFDRLARRYRAIATDLETGERVVLAGGDLARAARASMAYPGFFAPVRWEDDLLLVDGGIADNLGTLEARRLGAATIIAVDVARPPEEVSQEPLVVAGRALQLMQRNVVNDTLPPDILVLPNVRPAGVGPAFPDDPRPLIEAGREAARRDLPAAPPADAGGERPLPRPPERFAGLRVEAPDPALARLVREVFADVAPGPFDVRAVLSAVDRLYDTGLFTGVWPGVDRGDDADAPVLVVRVDAAARLTVSGAAGFDSDRGGRLWTVVDRTASLARRPVVFRAAVFTDGLHRWGSLAARIHTTASPAMAWIVGAHVRETSVRVFTDDTRVTTEVVRSGGRAGIELRNLLGARLVTLSGIGEWVDHESVPGTHAVGALMKITASAPTEAAVVGIPGSVEAEARWGGVEYRRFAVAASRTLAWSAFQAAVLMDLRGVDGDAPIDVHPSLGDEHAVPGLRWGEGRGRTRAVAGLDLAVPVPLGGFARLRLRSGAVGDTPRDWRDARWVSGALLGGIWRTPLGVLEVGYGRATIGDGRIDISLGRSF